MTSPRTVVLHGLQRRASLNGQQARLEGYQAHHKRFKVRLLQSGIGVEALPCNMRWPDGKPITIPVSVVASVGGGGQQKMLQSQWCIQPGEVIVEELPSVVVGQTDGDFALSDALAAFFQLTREQQAILLSLQANSKIATVDGTTSTDAIVRQLMLDSGVIPHGEEATASKFLGVFDANSFQFQHSPGKFLGGVFPLLSRVNHSCSPTAVRYDVGGGLRLVALVPIPPGSEITISYLPSERLFAPRAVRHERLSSWFPTCWCARCAESVETVRRFPCDSSTMGCRGDCTAAVASAAAHGGTGPLKDALDVADPLGASIASPLQPCRLCGSTPTAESAAAALRWESQLHRTLAEWSAVLPGEGFPATTAQVVATLGLARKALAPAHWLRAALCALAAPPLVAAGERTAAVECLGDWCDGWAAAFGTACLPAAWRREGQGDLIAQASPRSRATLAAAAAAYRRAQSELKRLAMPMGLNHTAGIQEKLREVERASEDDSGG